jgi:hypothetical protein
MSLNKLKSVATVFLTASLVALGGGLLTRLTTAADQPDAKKLERAEQPPPRPVAKGGEKPVVGPTLKHAKDRLEIRAAGKQVEVRAVFAGEELDAVAGRVSYEEESKLLVLESAGEDEVKVRVRRGQTVEHITCKKMTLDRKAGTMLVAGGGAAQLAVPMSGPVPIALDFCFPLGKGLHENKQVFSFFMGFTR